MITEICQGVTILEELRSRDKKKEYFSEKDAAQIMIQILGAISYANNKKIIHRDLKTENIIIEIISESSNLK